MRCIGLRNGDEAMNEAKPGWKTTEFWVTIVGIVSSLALLTGTITPEQNQQVAGAADTIAAAAVQIAGAIGTVVSVVAYAIGRSRVKGKA
jgi:hypothetical protein